MKCQYDFILDFGSYYLVCLHTYIHNVKPVVFSLRHCSYVELITQLVGPILK